MKKYSFGLGLLLLVAPLGLACAPEQPLNVLLVTFDTTRADHLGCYGHEGVATPNVDRLAAEGTRFERAFTTVPLTTPSHSTIMTGKYPLAHGVRDNGMFVLPDSQETLAEILVARGWSTAAAIGAFPLTRQFGTHQGFQLYDDRINQSHLDIFGEREQPKGALFFDERRAARVNEALFPWLEEHREEPFFVWAHYFDPHQPFAPPPPYDQLYVADPYLGEIAYADESLGKLLERLEDYDLYDRTIVILAADHGEGRGEHNELTHSIQLYNTTLRVPLIIKAPGLPAGRVVEAPVGTVDIVPTVLDILGMPVPEGVQGTSLTSAMRGDPQAEEALRSRPLYAETLSPRLSFGWGELRALIRGEHKYIFGPRPELYDLRTDPRELEDLVASDPQTADRYQRDLARFMREEAAADLDAAVEMDEATRQKLMALGYLGGDGEAPGEIEEVLRRDGDAPQDRVADISTISAAKQLLFSNRPLPARELLSELLERNPESQNYLEMIATANLQLGLFEEALGALERIRGLDSSSATADRLTRQLGLHYTSVGDYDKAEELLRQSDREGTDPAVPYLISNIHQARGDADAELRALRTALEIDPTFAPARIDLAIRFARAGDKERARSEFERALRDQPYFHRGFYNYGAFLAESGDLTEAVERFERAVELEPAYWLGHFALVSVHLSLDDVESARRQYDRLRRLAPASPEAEGARQLLEQAT